MAKKPFYSMDEVCAKLSKSQDEIKALVREGLLREFRDAGKIFFKAEDIDRLAGPAAGGDQAGEIVLEPAIDLDALDDRGKASGSGSGSGDLTPLVETSEGTSIIGLEPLAEEEEQKQEKKKGDTAVTHKGIGVFDDDDVEIDADPMAKTQITTGTTEGDQITLEGAGSGSGLLDLAREADDTALGADLLDEIYPGEEEAAQAERAAPAEAPAAKEPEPEPEAIAEPAEMLPEEEVALPVAVATGDPSEGLFTGLMVGGLILMGVAATVVAGALQGFLPPFGRFLSDGTNFYFYLGGSVLLAVIALVVGWFLGKTLAPRGR